MSTPRWCRTPATAEEDRKSTRLNSSHTVIYTLSLHDALPISKTEETADLLALKIGVGVRGAHVHPQMVQDPRHRRRRSEERRVGKECRSRCDWSSDVCSSDLKNGGDG